jgi:hypothetical protein
MPFATSQAASAQISDVISKDAGLATALRRDCAYPQPPPPSSTPSIQATPSFSPALIPIVGAVVQLGFEALIDKKRRDIAAINDAATASYALNVAIAPSGDDGLASARCLVILRYAEDEKGKVNENMAAVLRLRNHSSGSTPSTNVVSFKPVFVRANNAVATTRDAEKPTVNLTFAVSVKAVAVDNAGTLSRLVPAGESVATVRDLILGAPGTPSCATDDCPESDLLPYPTNRGVLSLSVAVAEQGKTGFDNKVVDAELAAVKAALGPAIGAAVKAKLAE